MALLTDIQLLSDRVDVSSVLVDKLRADKIDLERRLRLAENHNKTLEDFVETYKVDEEKIAASVDKEVESIESIDNLDDIDMFALTNEEFEKADKFAMGASSQTDGLDLEGLEDLSLDDLEDLDR